MHHVWRSCVTNQDTSANLGWARATSNGIALFGRASASRRLFVCELYTVNLFWWQIVLKRQRLVGCSGISYCFVGCWLSIFPFPNP